MVRAERIAFGTSKGSSNEGPERHWPLDCKVWVGDIFTSCKHREGFDFNLGPRSFPLSKIVLVFFLEGGHKNLSCDHLKSKDREDKD